MLFLGKITSLEFWTCKSVKIDVNRDKSLYINVTFFNWCNIDANWRKLMSIDTKPLVGVTLGSCDIYGLLIVLFVKKVNHQGLWWAHGWFWVLRSWKLKWNVHWQSTLGFVVPIVVPKVVTSFLDTGAIWTKQTLPINATGLLRPEFSHTSSGPQSLNGQNDISSYVPCRF